MLCVLLSKKEFFFLSKFELKTDQFNTTQFANRNTAIRPSGLEMSVWGGTGGGWVRTLELLDLTTFSMTF